MGSMMAALKPLVEPDQENTNLDKLLPLLDKIGVSWFVHVPLSPSIRAYCVQNDLSECGNVLDVYKKQMPISKSFYKGLRH